LHPIDVILNFVRFSWFNRNFLLNFLEVHFFTFIFKNYLLFFL